MSQTACIIGATSSLAQILCRQLAEQGTNLCLVARDQAELESMQTDLQIRYGVEVQIIKADLLAAKFSAAALMKKVGDVDSLYLLVGDMGSDDKDSATNIEKTMRVTLTAPTQILGQTAKMMEKRGSGEIIIISSVAGDRGRKSNYIYGAAKAGLTAVASGLRNRLNDKGVHVMTVKPGFVDTPMTWGMDSPLIASREKVSASILQSLEKRKDVIYVPCLWWGIMTIIKLIPERIFKRLSL